MEWYLYYSEMMDQIVVSELKYERLLWSFGYTSHGMPDSDWCEFIGVL